LYILPILPINYFLVLIYQIYIPIADLPAAG
jgi:hypothetical protein